jgi:IS30 family transposase
VVAKLRAGWSPQQIAGRSKIDGPEGVSHEYVYALVQRDKKRGGKLFRLLTRFGKRKLRLGARSYPIAPVASDRVSIDKRPAIVATRRGVPTERLRAQLHRPEVEKDGASKGEDEASGITSKAAKRDQVKTGQRSGEQDEFLVL